MITTPIRILIADDHNLIREGIKRILGFHEDLSLVGEAVDGIGAEGAVGTLRPDILVMDVNMPGKSGLQVLQTLRKAGSPVKVIFLTVAGDQQTLMEAVHLGAEGYLLKDSDIQELVRAIREVHSGENYIDQRLVKLMMRNFAERTAAEANPLKELTPRELEILYFTSQGLSNREVGERLFLSEKTVKNNLILIFRKLGVKDRVQATLLALKHHIEDLMKLSTVQRD